MEDEYLMFIENIYNEYLEQTEGRNISYGEMAYIQDLDEQGLKDLEEELMEALG